MRYTGISEQQRDGSVSQHKRKGNKMSFDLSKIKWGRVVLWIVLGFLISFLIPNVIGSGYLVVLGFQMRGTPPQEVQIAVLTSPFYNLMAILGTLVGGFIGGRQAARKAEEGGCLINGLAVGIGVAVLATVYAVIRVSSFTFWVPLHFILGIVGGWLGGWLAARRAQDEEF